jgi:para-aminobenzoate synthetase/4-amino-4-deoxychorismate lyase
MSAAFELLETMRWTPELGFFLLDRHLARLTASARHFGFACDAARIRSALDRAVAGSSQALRVRLLVAADGSPRVEHATLDPLPTPARVVLARTPIDPADPFLRHKTTNRAVYNDARHAAADTAIDDVILWNPDRQVTESTIANIVVQVEERKMTPPIACGLLAGTFRAQLLQEGAIEEAIVSVDQLLAASRFWLINSVREWRPAVFVPQAATTIASTPMSASAATPQTTKPSHR